MGRATFYAQYASKHELLRYELRHVVVPLARSQPQSACLLDCRALFDHIRHARRIYRSLTSGPSRLVTEGIVQDCLEERIALELRSSQSNAASRRGGENVVGNVLPRFVAASLLTLIAWWVENDAAVSSEEMQSAFESLVSGSFGRPAA